MRLNILLPHVPIATIVLQGAFSLATTNPLHDNQGHRPLPHRRISIAFATLVKKKVTSRQDKKGTKRILAAGMKGLLLLAAAAAALPALSGATDPTQTPPEGASNQVAEEDKQDCPVDEDGDLEDPNNLFTCLKTEECCTVDLNPACCASKDTKDQM